MRTGLRSSLVVLIVLALFGQTVPAAASRAASTEPERVVAPREAKPPKNPKIETDPAWDPKDPAVIQYSDGAWGLAYNDNANPPNILFRRSLGGADPQYWKDPVSVETDAKSPAMVKLGSTTALFYRRWIGSNYEVYLRTSTDDGATWSDRVQLTSSTPGGVFQVQAVNDGGTVYVFYSRGDTSGTLQYRSSSDLSNWSAAATVGQAVGPLNFNTSPWFDIKKLANGDWAMVWQNVSVIPNGGYDNNVGFPVVWFARSSSLPSTTWTNKQEMTQPAWTAYRFPRAVGLAQASNGDVYLTYSIYYWAGDYYLHSRRSGDSGVTWDSFTQFGYEPSRPTSGGQGVHAQNSFPIPKAGGGVRVFWDMDVTIYDGAYPAQLFSRDLPTGAITQISISKDQKAKCGPCVPAGAFVADPVNATTGNFTLPETDIAIPGKGGAGLFFSRTYNSHQLVDGPLGFGWSHGLDEHLTEYSRGEVLIVDGSGRNDLYTPKAGGGYNPPPGHFGTLVHNGDGTWSLTETSKVKKNYSSTGKLTSIADRNNNALTLGYDGSGKLTTLTDPASRTLTFAYTGTRITSVSLPLSRTITYGYNAAGDLTSVTDPRGKVWSYTYDADHRMLTKKDPNNHSVLTNVYTSLDRVLTQTDAKGGVNRFNYASGGGRTDVVDPRNNTTVFYYDPSYRVTTVDDPYGKRINYTYDDKDNLTRIEDRRRTPINNTYFTYDSSGNVLTRTNGNNKVWSYTYNPFNQVLTETDSLNRVTTNTYDTSGNLTSTTNAKNQTTGFGVGAWGQMSSVTDARNKTTSLGYDSYGNQTTVTDAYNKTWTTSFDLGGRRTGVTDPLSHSTSFAYNDNDQLTSVTDARNKVTSFGYDDAGNRTSTTDPNNKVTSFGYDEKDRLLTVTDAASGVTTYSYDGNDNLMSVKDANNHTRSYTYDKNNLQLTEKDALNNTTTYEYNGALQRTKRTDAKSQVTTYSYDTINRMTTVTYPSSSVTYAYNDADAITSMTDSTGTTTYTLDELYRPSSITLPGSKTVGYLYDAAGNRTRVTYPDSKQVNYSYDDANRMSTVTDWDSAVTTYGYDDAGRLTSTSLPNGVVESKDYNAADQLTDITAVNSATTLTDFTYGLDNAGLRTSVTTPAGLESYTYDDLYRLTGVTYPDSSTQAYTYDAVGNRLTKVQGSTTSYTYDNADRMTSAGGVTYTYDNNGNQTARGSDVYGWDIEDRMTSATVGGNSATYTYRGDDLRNSKTVGGVTTTYIWDLASELPVVLQEGNTSYVYGLGLISQTTGSDKRYFLTDGLGSTAALTDGSGAVSATYAYDVFGAIRSSTGTDSTDFQFAGQQDDPTVGMQYLRARYYDPSTGRFLSKDPLPGYLQIPKSQHPFSYTISNPTNAVDPTGNDSFGDALASGLGRHLRDLPGKLANAAGEKLQPFTDACEAVDQFVFNHRNEIDTGLGLAAFGVCVWATAGVCGVVGGASFGWSTINRCYDTNCLGIRKNVPVDLWGFAWKTGVERAFTKVGRMAIQEAKGAGPVIEKVVKFGTHLPGLLFDLFVDTKK